MLLMCEGDDHRLSTSLQHACDLLEVISYPGASAEGRHVLIQLL